MSRIGRARLAIAEAFFEHHNEADEQTGNGGGNHDEANKTDGAKHDIPHCDLTRHGRLADRLDDDRAGRCAG